MSQAGGPLLDRSFGLRASSIRSRGEGVAPAEPAWYEEPVGQGSVIVLQLREIAGGALLHQVVFWGWPWEIAELEILGDCVVEPSADCPRHAGSGDTG